MVAKPSGIGRGICRRGATLPSGASRRGLPCPAAGPQPGASTRMEATSRGLRAATWASVQCHAAALQQTRKWWRRRQRPPCPAARHGCRRRCFARQPPDTAIECRFPARQPLDTAVVCRLRVASMPGRGGSLPYGVPHAGCIHGEWFVPDEPTRPTRGA